MAKISITIPDGTHCEYERYTRCQHLASNGVEVGLHAKCRIYNKELLSLTNGGYTKFRKCEQCLAGTVG